jgi:hypothetical protein
MAVRRRDAIDVARVLALLIVVLGHLTLAVVDRHGGSVRGANLLALRPVWAWAAAASPMPVFFAAAGWANAHSTVATAAPRLRTLVGVAAVVIACWSCGVVLAVAITGDAGIIGDGARVATQPAWFLAAYVPFAVAGGTLARIASRYSPFVTLGGCLTALAVLDVARFALSAPEWIGWLGFYLAWVVPWLAGGWWRAQWEGGFTEARAGIGIAIAAGLAATALVHWGGYAPQLIDVVKGARSNTTPPTLYTAVAALAQFGVLLVAARGLDVLGRRWRRLWDRAGEAAVGVYLWHLSALALCGGLVALGVPVPDRLTAAWWLTRPLWWSAVIGLATAFVVITDMVRRRFRRRPHADAPPDTTWVLAAVVLVAAGGGLVGLRGPRSVPLAITCSALFIAGWLALRVTRPSST